MFSQKSPFFQRSKRVAEEFLQTIVLVDDQAYFEAPLTNADLQQTLPSVLTTPGRRSDNPLELQSSHEQEELSVPSESFINSHQLHAQEVINSFAERRIICSVIKPAKDDNDWLNVVERLAGSADVFIIDWDIHNDHGRHALKLLEAISSSSLHAPTQLRLFVIYTGEPVLEQIVLTVKETLKKHLGANVKEGEDSFSLMFASTRIVFCSKPGTHSLSEKASTRKISFEGLVDFVISEFAVMTAGLVSNAVLRALTQIRLNTHKLLSAFSKVLNAPYLTHRALLPLTEDAEDLLNSLIAKEIQGILEEAHVGAEANIEAIWDWLESQQNKIEVKIAFDQQQSLTFDTSEKLRELLHSGIRKAIIDNNSGTISDLSKTKRNELVQKLESTFHEIPLTQSFGSNENVAPDSDDEFALITAMRSYYAGKAPKLTLGTILRSEESGAYWVCIQPRCDCVRIKGSRPFLLIPLTLQQSGQKFDIIVKENGKYARLVVTYKPFKLNLLPFESKPQANGMIVAEKVDNAYYFFDLSKSRHKWLGELRSEHAQRIANQFASNLSRVGLDESEWLRLWATKGVG